MAPKSSATELAKNVRSANASKIDAINALNAALLGMIDEANRQIAGLSGEAA